MAAAWGATAALAASGRLAKAIFEYLFVRYDTAKPSRAVTADHFSIGIQGRFRVSFD